MLGRLSIFNMALGFIGTRILASENERTPEALQCQLYWDRARRSALRDFPYPFSQRQFQLARLEMPKIWKTEWQYAYALPQDTLKVVRVGDCQPFAPGQYPMPGVGVGLAIFCNEPDAVAVCTVDVPDLNLWDEIVIMAVAYRLAMLIAVPLLKNNTQKIQELASLYNSILPKAEGHAASEGRRAREDVEDWLAARWGWN